MARLGLDMMKVTDPPLKASWIERGNPLVLAHRRGSGVIGRQGQGQVAGEFLQETGEVLDPRADVGHRVIRVGNPIMLHDHGHQLHQPLGPFGRNLSRVSVGLGEDDGLYQSGRNPMLKSDFFGNRQQPRREAGGHEVRNRYGSSVQVAGRQVHLTPSEYRLLTTLIRHAGKVMTHNQLLTEVWGPNQAEQAHYLRVYAAQLRRKLEADPARPRYLLTEPGVGYRLAAE